MGVAQKEVKSLEALTSGFGLAARSGLGRLVREYMLYLAGERGLGFQTCQTYLYNLKAFFRAFPDPLAATKETLSSYLAGRRFKGIAVASNSCMTAALRSFYSYLAAREIIKSDPSSELRTKKAKRLPRYLTMEELRRLLTYPKTKVYRKERFRLMMLLMYSSGLRIGEVSRLRVCDVSSGGLRVIGKGDRERWVPVLPVAMADIEQFIKWKGFDSTASYLFLSQKGRPVSSYRFNAVLKAWARRVGIVKNVHAHLFRHSFCTYLLRGGANLLEVQRMAGHEDINTTTIYTHLESEGLAQAHSRAHPGMKCGE